MLPGIFGVLILPVLTRLFSPEEYGIYTIVLTTVSVLTILSTEWIGPSAIRFYSHFEKQGNLGTFGTTLLWMGGVSVAVTASLAGVVIGLLGTRLHADRGYLYMGLALFVTTACASILLQVLVARRKATVYSFFSVWQQCVCVALGLCLAGFLSLGVKGMILATTVGIGVALPFLFARAFTGLTNGDFSRSAASAVMLYGFPLMITNLAAWGLHLSDRYVIQSVRGSHEVGLYAVSYSIADRSVSLILSLVALASGPIAMDLWEKQGAQQTRLFITKLTKYFLIIASPAAVGLSLLGEPVLRLLASPKYHEGYKIMPLIAASMFLLGLQRNFQLGLLFHKRTRTIMVILLVSSALNLALNLFLVPRWGFVGAGWSALVGYGLLALLVILTSRQCFVWSFPFDTLLRVLAALLLMGAVVCGVRYACGAHPAASVCLAVPLGAAAYSVALLGMKEINLDVVKQELAVWRRPGLPVDTAAPVDLPD